MMDYLNAVKEVSGQDIFCSEYDFVTNKFLSNPAVQLKWVNNNGSVEKEALDTNFSSLVESSLGKLLSLLETPGIFRDETDTDLCAVNTARAIEYLCTLIISKQHSRNVKPTTPNGYYGFDGGRTKPDCVEVAIRELIDYLLWDDHTGCFDLSRLPPTAAPELVALYESEDALYKNSLEGHGRKWFEVLSDIPGCLYLSSSPNGKPYELTPTLRNMAKVCRRLMYNDGSLTLPVDEKQDWGSLSSLQACWGPQDLQISLDTLAEKAKMSPDIFFHEIATIKRKDKSNAIELRLRCDWARNTGFATVTHLRLQEVNVNPVQLDQLLNLTAMQTTETYNNTYPIVLLTLALLSDYGVLAKEEPRNMMELLISLLSSRYGMDRRELMQIASTSDLEREELALKKAFRESERVIKSATIKVCDFLSDNQNASIESAEGQLLLWILAENPTIDSSTLDSVTVRYSKFDTEVQQRILRLPGRVLTDDCFKMRLENNWAVRGRAVRALIDWRSSEKSFMEAVRGFNFGDMRFFLGNLHFHIR
jgi:hypothetical protein